MFSGPDPSRGTGLGSSRVGMAFRHYRVRFRRASQSRRQRRSGPIERALNEMAGRPRRSKTKMLSREPGFGKLDHCQTPADGTAPAEV